MKLEHAINVLEKELKDLNRPVDENQDEDYVDSVINFRNKSDINLALKILKDSLEVSKLINL